MQMKFIRFLMTTISLAILLAVVSALVAPLGRISAQGSNLLQDPTFSGSGWHTRSDVDGQMPPGWNVWSSASLKPVSDFNQYLPHTRSAPGSWVIRSGSVQITGGGFYQATVTPGSTYRFTIYVLVHSCNDPSNSCIGADGRKSDRSLGSRVRVGVDTSGGTNAGAGTVSWGTLSEAYDAFVPLSIDFVATTSQITLFTYSTVATSAWLNEAYWDDASLVAIAAGDVPSSATEVAPVSQTVPFVTPQQAQADGSVVHTVAEGDTFDSIYVAYRHLSITRDMILGLNGWEEPPRWIVVGEKIKILPAGSVDPATGRLLRVPGTTNPSPTIQATSEAPIQETTEPTTPTTPAAPANPGDITKGG